MDRLVDLPEKNTVHTAEESQVMKHFFGEEEIVTSDGGIKSLQWKKIAAISAAFILLVNPLTAACFSKLPYCDGLSGTLVKTVLFVTFLILILLYI